MTKQHRTASSAGIRYLTDHPQAGEKYSMRRDDRRSARSGRSTEALDAVQRVDGIRADPRDARVRALDRRDLYLDEQLGPSESGDSAAERRRTAFGEPRRFLTVRAIHPGAVDGEGAPPDDVVQSRARLLERPSRGLHRQVGLRRPVARRLRLARGVHRRAAADPDPVADRHGPRVAARLLTLLLGIDVAAGLRGA